MITVYKYDIENFRNTYWNYLITNETLQIMVGDTLHELFEDKFDFDANENNNNTKLTYDGFKVIFKSETVQEARLHFINEYPEEFI